MVLPVKKSINEIDAEMCLPHVPLGDVRFHTHLLEIKKNKDKLGKL